MRATVLQRAETLSNQVRTAADQLANYRTELFSQARDVVGEINTKLENIAELSGRINEAAAAGQDAADLRDKRDALLVELTKKLEENRIVENPS